MRGKDQLYKNIWKASWMEITL